MSERIQFKQDLLQAKLYEMLLYQVTNPVSLLSSLMLQAVVVFFNIFKKKKKKNMEHQGLTEA